MKKADAIQTLTKCRRILEAVDKKLMEKDIKVIEQIMLYMEERTAPTPAPKRKTTKKATLDGKEFLRDVKEKLPPKELLDKYELNVPIEYLNGTGQIVAQWNDLNKTAKNKYKIPELQSIYILLNKSATYKKSWPKKKLIEEIDSSVASWLRSERLTKV